MKVRDDSPHWLMAGIGSNGRLTFYDAGGRSWPNPEVPITVKRVRLLGLSGKHLLNVSLSHSDSEEAFAGIVFH